MGLSAQSPAMILISHFLSHGATTISVIRCFTREAIKILCFLLSQTSLSKNQVKVKESKAKLSLSLSLNFHMDIDFNEYQLSSELQGHEDDVRLLISLTHIFFNFALSLFLICIWFYKLIYNHKCCQISIIVKTCAILLSFPLKFISYRFNCYTLHQDC